MSFFSMHRSAGMALIALVLIACGSKISLDNYNKLKAGQTYEEVKQILGEPARCDEVIRIRTCQWGEEQRGISVNFVAGQVILLSAKNLK